ncbi:HNH endonuclease [Rhodococcus sp. G-MC3]|uniref:HNH endonuclease n=1 Tax=Rhodococcus sp. G-MC3 TaxID=3046209 RepID=UPI0024B8F2C8|nr:HNH endonuclease [Rhodococcus sp. G-MC3]MDJ0395915.1 HNH endonuclease [Rhodococcus sp. G-MC3]
MSFDILELPQAQLTLEYEPAGDCLIYLGPTNADGYGYLTVNGKREFAHRLVFAEFNGSIPNKKRVLHSCEHRGCIEKSHLHLSTPKVNPAGFRRRSVCKFGHALTDDNIIQTQAGRVCKKCRTEYKAAWYRRKRAENIIASIRSDSNE